MAFKSALDKEVIYITLPILSGVPSFPYGNPLTYPSFCSKERTVFSSKGYELKCSISLALPVSSRTVFDLYLLLSCTVRTSLLQ